MKTIIFRILILSLASRHSHAAVTWNTIGCAGWTFQNSNIDAIWDNANLMATNAQSQISAIPSSFQISSLGRRAGANAEFMFGIPWNKMTGTNSAGTATMDQVNTVYNNIQGLLEGTLPGFQVNNAYLFCGGAGLVQTDFPGNPFGSKVWNAEIRDPATNAITERIILRFATDVNWPQPCTEVDPNDYQAKTFDAVQVTGSPPVTNTFTGVILCTNQFPASGVATLTQGFAPDIPPRGPLPDPDQYLSLAGTIVHEMAHVIGRTRGQLWQDTNTAFNQCLNLAQANTAGALLTNPDNYRVFAEMSMSPATKWGAPPPRDPNAPTT